MITLVITGGGSEGGNRSGFSLQAAVADFENWCFVEAKQLFSENKVLLFRVPRDPPQDHLFELPGVPGGSQTDPPGCPREPKWNQNGPKMEPKGVNKGRQNRTFIK